MRNGYILGRLLAKGFLAAGTNEALSKDAKVAIESAATAMPKSSARAQQIRDLAATFSTPLDPSKVNDPRALAWLAKDLPAKDGAASPLVAFTPRRGFVADDGVRNALRALVGKD